MSNTPTPPFPGNTLLKNLTQADLYRVLVYHGCEVTLRRCRCGTQDVVWSLDSGQDGYQKRVVAKAYHPAMDITVCAVGDAQGRTLAYPQTLADVVVTLGRYVTRRGIRTLGQPCEADRLLHLDAYDAPAPAPAPVPPPKVWTVDDRIAEVPPEVLHSFLRDAGFDVSLQPWAQGQAVVWTAPVTGHTALQSRVVALWADKPAWSGQGEILNCDGQRLALLRSKGSTVRSLLDTLRRTV